ncbi:hypothetical protein HBI55_119740 [Parastagonospora nodorum]|nr:hypothetical protein HBI55_119740 [Parastagonospora nodorum]
MSAIPNLPTDTPGYHANGITNGTAKTPFKISDAPVENQRRLKVIVIGAGYSGIVAVLIHENSEVLIHVTELTKLRKWTNVSP